MLLGANQALSPVVTFMTLQFMSERRMLQYLQLSTVVTVEKSVQHSHGKAPPLDGQAAHSEATATPLATPSEAETQDETK